MTWCGAARFYLGQTWQPVLQLLAFTILPLFLVAFGLRQFLISCCTPQSELYRKKLSKSEAGEDADPESGLSGEVGRAKDPWLVTFAMSTCGYIFICVVIGALYFCIYINDLVVFGKGHVTHDAYGIPLRMDM